MLLSYQNCAAKPNFFCHLRFGLFWNSKCQFYRMFLGSKYGAILDQTT
uniref:Uncharacterized protein n=1 Tax=Rhizophora mucronata TaxID=61149 RepID=A0A2P2JUP9_RHIMU